MVQSRHIAHPIFGGFIVLPHRFGVIVVSMALPVLAASALSTGITSAAASAPLPVPTHFSTEPCDGVGAERACDAVDALKAQVICTASVGVDATPVAAPGGYTDWHYTFSSGHSCPISSGDLVRMSGTLIGDVNGYRVNMVLCSGMGSCGNSFSGIALGGPAMIAHALTATQSYDTPHASSVDRPRTFIFP